MKKEAYFKLMGLNKKAQETDKGFFAGLADWFKRQNTPNQNMNMEHPGNRTYISNINKLPGGKASGADEVNSVTKTINTTKPIINPQKTTLGDVRANQAGTQARALLGGKFGNSFPLIKETLKSLGKAKQALPSQDLKVLQGSPREKYLQTLFKLIKNPELKKDMLYKVPEAIQKEYEGNNINSQWQKLLDAYRFQANKTPAVPAESVALS